MLKSRVKTDNLSECLVLYETLALTYVVDLYITALTNYENWNV